MTDLSTHICTPTRPTRGPSLMHYIDLYRQRRALKGLDQERLDDLGLSKKQALTEANRPIWDAPSHWHSDF